MKTEALLKKYLESNLSGEERFELEKRVLDDDFLADAWEGLQVDQKADKLESWKSLQARWVVHPKQKKQTKIIPFRKWMPIAAAASALILAGAYFWLNPMNDTGSSSAVALQTETTTETATESVIRQEDLVKELKMQDALEQAQQLSKTESIVTGIKTVSTEDQPLVINESPVTNVPEKPSIELSFPTGAAQEDNRALLATDVSQVASNANEYQDETPTVAIAADPPILLKKDNTSTAIMPEADIALKTDGQVAAQPNSKIESTVRQKNKVSVLQEGLSRRAAASEAVPQREADATPDIGWEAFNQILKKYGYTKEKAFMNGLKPPIKISVQFELDENRFPENIKIVRGIKDLELVTKVLGESGTWSATSSDETIEIEIAIPIIAGE